MLNRYISVVVGNIMHGFWVDLEMRAGYIMLSSMQRRPKHTEIQMSFEFFRHSGRGFQPKASVRKQGQIGLNQGSVKRYDLSDWEYVILGYDADHDRIAIKRATSNEAGATKLVIRDSNASIAAKSFFDYYMIPYEATRQYPLDYDKDQEMLIFEIEGGDADDEPNKESGQELFEAN